jgi:hypothetical protein
VAALRIVGVFFVLLSGVFAYLIISGPAATRGIFVFLLIEFIVLAVIFILVARAMTRAAQHAAQLLHDGLPADATVVSVADTGVTINNNPRVKLQLHVVPSSGDPFDISVTKLVSRIAIPRAGETHKIKYNVANPQDFVFADEAAASGLAAGSDMEKKLQAALAERGILGDQSDGASVSFQTKTDVIGAGQPTQKPPAAHTIGAKGEAAAVAGASNGANPTSTPSAPSLAEQLTKLEELRDRGVVNVAEFDEIKQRLLSGS